MANNLVSVDDLRKDALKGAGELADGTSDYDVLSNESNAIKDLDAIADFYKLLHAGGTELDVTFNEPFDWLKADKPEILKIVPEYSTGTISLTNDSTAGTLSTAPAAGLGSFKDHILIIDSRNTVYRISAHTAAGTSITLDQAYLEATGATLSFTLIKTDYTLTNPMAQIYKTLRINKLQIDEDGTGEITHLTESVFDRENSWVRRITGAPTRFTIIKNVENLLTLRFNRAPKTDSIRVEIPYIPTPEELIVAEFATTDVDTAGDYVTIASHGLITDQPVRLSSSTTLPSGLLPDVTYYIIKSTVDRIQFAAAKEGTAIVIADTGTGTHTITSVPRMPLEIRPILRDYARYIILDDKSDDRAERAFKVCQAKLLGLVAATRKSQRFKSRDRGRLIPRRDDRSIRNALHIRLPGGDF